MFVNMVMGSYVLLQGIYDVYIWVNVLFVMMSIGQNKLVVCVYVDEILVYCFLLGVVQVCMFVCGIDVSVLLEFVCVQLYVLFKVQLFDQCFECVDVCVLLLFFCFKQFDKLVVYFG